MNQFYVSVSGPYLLGYAIARAEIPNIHGP